ncbi:hypothetical protein DH2020_006120 [Rehmannia glutinosa]|uniref:Uncharacterized protein n=1 Tax=Rehmannia glutinosa TaxID=99300 RepID=A0ABR0XIL2_REHGL
MNMYYCVLCCALFGFNVSIRLICNYIFAFQIYAPTNPRGAESLPPGIVVSKSDFYLRRLCGEPSEDLKRKPKYLVTFTVGLNQKNNINAAVKKFSEDFQIMLFHYDGRTSEWKKLYSEVVKLDAMWYAKRFLHLMTTFSFGMKIVDLNAHYSLAQTYSDAFMIMTECEEN